MGWKNNSHTHFAVMAKGNSWEMKTELYIYKITYSKFGITRFSYCLCLIDTYLCGVYVCASIPELALLRKNDKTNISSILVYFHLLFPNFSVYTFSTHSFSISADTTAKYVPQRIMLNNVSVQHISVLGFFVLFFKLHSSISAIHKKIHPEISKGKEIITFMSQRTQETLHSASMSSMHSPERIICWRQAMLTFLWGLLHNIWKSMWITAGGSLIRWDIKQIIPQAKFEGKKALPMTLEYYTSSEVELLRYCC